MYARDGIAGRWGGCWLGCVAGGGVGLELGGGVLILGGLRPPSQLKQLLRGGVVIVGERARYHSLKRLLHGVVILAP